MMPLERLVIELLLTLVISREELNAFYALAAE